MDTLDEHRNSESDIQPIGQNLPTPLLTPTDKNMCIRPHAHVRTYVAGPTVLYQLYEEVLRLHLPLQDNGIISFPEHIAV